MNWIVDNFGTLTPFENLDVALKFFNARRAALKDEYKNSVRFYEVMDITETVLA